MKEFNHIPFAPNPGYRITNFVAQCKFILKGVLDAKECTGCDKKLKEYIAKYTGEWYQKLLKPVDENDDFESVRCITF